MAVPAAAIVAERAQQAQHIAVVYMLQYYGARRPALVVGTRQNNYNVAQLMAYNNKGDESALQLL